MAAMTGKARYLWGVTKLDKAYITSYMDLEAQSSAPDARQGRIYIDSSTGKLKLSADGTNWETVTSS